MSDETQDPDPAEEAWIDEVSEGERPCPVCGSTMILERKNDVTIDVCPDHGIWLDAGELERITASIRKRAWVRQRAAARRARREGKRQGVFYGWWSLIGD